MLKWAHYSPLPNNRAIAVATDEKANENDVKKDNKNTHRYYRSNAKNYSTEAIGKAEKNTKKYSGVRKFL